MSVSIRLALWVEGPSDLPFLQRLMYRATHHAAHDALSFSIDIEEQFLRPDRFDPTTATTRVLRLMQAFSSQLSDRQPTIMFVHADADGDADVALSNAAAPGLSALQSISGPKFAGVPIIPVRCTEAWALADVDALRRTLGTTRSLAELGLPERLAHHPEHAESLNDPKGLLAEVTARANPHRRGRRAFSSQPTIPDGLGDDIDLDRLNQLPAFKCCCALIEQAVLKVTGQQG